MGQSDGRLSDSRVYMLMVLATFFWSGAFIAGKLSLSQFSPFTLTFLRFFIALPFIFAILYKRQPECLKPARHQWLPLILLGTVGTFGYHVLFFFALKHTTAINSSLIGSTNPMVTTLLAVWFFREKITPIRLAGIILSFLGVVLVISKGNLETLSALSFNPGDMMMLIAVLCMAVYALLSRRFMDKYGISPLIVTAYTFLICSVISLPFVIWENPLKAAGHYTLGGWLSVLYMAVFSSVLGYLFQLIAIGHMGASKTAIFFNLVPAFTIFQSVLFLKESIDLLKLVSAAIIISGVYLTTRPEKIKESVEMTADSGKDIKS